MATLWIGGAGNVETDKELNCKIPMKHLLQVYSSKHNNAAKLWSYVTQIKGIENKEGFHANSNEKKTIQFGKYN